MSPHDPILEGLEQLRKRLLDLSKRNKLLNFRHSGKSSLRVVDELPDELFKCLRNGTTLVFRPVPEPPHLGDDELDKPSSTLFLPINEGEKENVSKKGSKSRKIPAKDHAATIGINTSYDLPTPGIETNPKHSDKYIQTLHYPDELEGILRQINTIARTAIEESGTNMLYLIFGFLEWYESSDSNQPLLSPLLTLPVELIRDKP